ncbi:MAG: hypothetical protein H5U24_00120 [Thioclava marina]|jgi:hypothetical protein|uniref:Uncharacterized protein n=1 Tax=Thioclava marina TaxID=1915077 RepID=A0ABX3MLC0_9RHOB|nr:MULTISPECIES: hypothetical protein [Thioclava]MBC7143789.1 hypothetical protein [Thioclava marina]MBD3802653.1 hypothetical protein [Thioclava sp.]OOY12355.1 hypothetical protein BMG00_00345 [Thioclava marina]OOY28317.1 hypothetical protein BMI90_06410 [Thioclava sp. L04-15]
MALIDELAEKLAAETMEAMRKYGDDRLFMEVGNYIGTSSPSLQEAFMTACRLHMAEQRGRDFFEKRLRELDAKARKAAQSDASGDEA